MSDGQHGACNTKANYVLKNENWLAHPGENGPAGHGRKRGWKIVSECVTIFERAITPRLWYSIFEMAGKIQWRAIHGLVIAARFAVSTLQFEVAW